MTFPVNFKIAGNGGFSCGHLGARGNVRLNMHAGGFSELLDCRTRAGSLMSLSLLGDCLTKFIVDQTHILLVLCSEFVPTFLCCSFISGDP